MGRLGRAHGAVHRARAHSCQHDVCVHTPLSVGTRSAGVGTGARRHVPWYECKRVALWHEARRLLRFEGRVITPWSQASCAVARGDKRYEWRRVPPLLHV